MTLPDPEVWEQMMGAVLSRQRPYDTREPSPGKVAAKRRAAELVATVAKPGDRIMDVGGEIFYLPGFHEQGILLEAMNITTGTDMHAISARAEYDGALAMHVLEHSPVPLFVLSLIKRAVKPGGFLYVAVPHPTRKWLRHSAHFTVLHPTGWARLLEDAGFTVMHAEEGKFGPKSMEERFLCSA